MCEIAEVQPYVLRSWEAEFPDLGLSKGEGGARVYRRADVERVLRLKHLLFVEGLTLAGARRQMSVEDPDLVPPVPDEDIVVDADVAALLDEQVRRHLRDVRQGLQWILGVLNGRSHEDGEFRLTAASDRRAGRRRARPSRASRPVRSRTSARARSTRPLRRTKKAIGKRKR